MAAAKKVREHVSLWKQINCECGRAVVLGLVCLGRRWDGRCSACGTSWRLVKEEVLPAADKLVSEEA